MAHHKKKRAPKQRAHCHMCKPWKDGNISHESELFERFSAHKKRLGLRDDIREGGF